ncbi:hypothetical protein JK386_18055 [Nocardioides sp. zg-536]|uniref:Matrixin family metalloprotease n=1 Tax=Nocardioides faecalis TaxID=2803858 RepID=A0A938Y9S5_9ACTN|nr:hypothetical protein [Nocardioides faecalis]MBM9461797.1 hypothetical protein [Nocardioides faecalis]MBS4751826.1 hypothetical protein [Nocardioides faecalis]QVI59314.1 hypothetical protein KG111_02795 [Nocardioides faecalis]
MGGNRSDAAPLTFTYVDLIQAMDNATDWVRANDIQPAGLPTSYDATPPSNIDVIVIDRQYGNAEDPFCDQAWATSGTSGGIMGLTTCNSINSSNQCQSADVRYNNNWTFDVGTSAERHLACHENGHAIGLKHPVSSAEMFGQGCMNFGTGEVNYTSHDRGHIAAAF